MSQSEPFSSHRQESCLGVKRDGEFGKLYLKSVSSEPSENSHSEYSWASGQVHGKVYGVKTSDVSQLPWHKRGNPGKIHILKQSTLQCPQLISCEDLWDLVLGCFPQGCLPTAAVTVHCQYQWRVPNLRSMVCHRKEPNRNLWVKVRALKDQTLGGGVHYR